MKNNIRVLLIEDDEDDYVLTVDLLEEIYSDNFTLDWASDIKAAKRSFTQEAEYDICLLDYQLGETTGVELLKLARKIGFETPIIMLTGQTDLEVDRSAAKAGAADYLLKSGLDAENLGRAFRYALSRKEIEEAKLEKLRAQERDRLKSEFLAHLSHELRTPLTAILGFAENLLHDVDNDMHREQVDTIYKNGKHLLGLLNDILDLSKIEAGKLETDINDLDLLRLINEIFSLMEIHAHNKGLILKVFSETPIPKTIRSDKKRLRQILINLISNAIKFTHTGSVILKLSFSSTNSHGSLIFSVIDTGVGIGEQDSERIFQAFERGGMQQSSAKPGSGLGLAISKQIAKLLGGDLRIVRSSDKGSEFQLSLMIAPPVEELEMINFSTPCDNAFISTSLPEYHGRVLLVDDMRDIRTLVSEKLRHAGVEVISCESGYAAIQAIEQSQNLENPFDFILMDLDMPDMNGEQATQQIREMGVSIPVIAFTAAMMRNERHQYFDMGFDDLISKPIITEELIALLDKHLQRKDEQKSSLNKDLNILIVEDNPDAAGAIASLLNALSVDTTIALTGAEALNKMTTGSYKAVLLDKNLPDADGTQLAEQIKSIVPDTRIFLLTGEQVSAPENSPIEKTFQKPIDLNSLKSIISLFDA